MARFVALAEPLHTIAGQIRARRDRQAEIDRTIPDLWLERDVIDAEIDQLLDLWSAERA